MADHFGGVASQADVEGSHTKLIYGAVITVTILATIAVILRFLARRKSAASISYDDYLIVIALLFLYGLNLDVILDADLWGLGKHFSTLSQDQLLSFQKNGLANFALYFTTTATIKISLLLLYYRLFFPSRPFRIAVYTAAAIVLAWWIAVLFADIFQCVPVEAFWEIHGNNMFHNTATCMNTITFSIGTGVSNLLTDIIVLSLPIPMVWSLKQNRTQKITMTGIFLLGFFVCATSIVRTVKLVSVGHQDPTYSLTSVFIWTSVEPSVGIISACLPILRPLFGHWLSATVPSRSKSGKEPSAKRTTSSSQPASASLASPAKDGFTRLEGPTYRDQLELSYPEGPEISTIRNGSLIAGAGGPVATSSYGDKRGTSWLMYGPGRGGAEDWRLEEGRGVGDSMQMQEWPRRRESADWKIAFG
ncbi:hypothetical protein BDR22DRAFT_852859 [Usnea florida]